MIPLLQFSGIEKRYGAVRALAGVDLVVGRGSTLALLGPNGAGKSTLFNCLLGLARPTSGEILVSEDTSAVDQLRNYSPPVDASDVLARGRTIRESDRARFGYTAERVALYPHRTVWDNGLFFARLKNQPVAELENQLRRVGLFDVRRRKVRQLSKGMLQRLGLAIALCGQPQLLVLDEPFNGLDPAQLDDLQQILRDERERGATLLIATHTMSAVEPLATHVAIMLDGRLATSGTFEELRERYPDETSLEAIYHRIARQRKPVAASRSDTAALETLA